LICILGCFYPRALSALLATVAVIDNSTFASSLPSCHRHLLPLSHILILIVVRFVSSPKSVVLPFLHHSKIDPSLEMPSFKISAVIMATLLSISGAQQYNIDPDTIPLATRASWCTSQIASCPLICLQYPGASATTTANDCDATTLAFDCVCSNGLSPNASEYSQTIPYFQCQAYGTQCVDSCGGDSTCQAACRDNNPCGAQSPTRINATSTSSSLSSSTLPAGASSGTAGVIYTGLGGAVATQSPSSGSDTKKSNAQTALDLGRSYGLIAVFTGLFAGFALVM